MLAITMKAYVVHQWGDMQFETVAMPTVRSSEVLVKVKAVSINPIDYLTRSGKGVASMLSLPIILGFDVAGVIEAVGIEVKTFTKGDTVFGLVNFPDVSGKLEGKCYAEYVAVPATQVIKIPEGLSFYQAAALPAVGLTAKQGLFDFGKLQEGQRVLIQGAAGGIGHIAIQLAKQAGVYVIATASTKNVSFVKSLGADEVVDYQKSAFEDVSDKVDLVFDLVGGDITKRSLQVLKKGGILSTTMWPVAEEVMREAEDLGIIVAVVGVKPQLMDLKELATKVATGELSINIDSIYPFEQLPKALEKLEKGSVVGKLVVKSE